jgi:hypothetical protein
MAIVTLSDLVEALANAQNVSVLKLSATAEGAGTWHSLWAVGGMPAAGAAPGATAIAPDNTTVGAMKLNEATGGDSNYFGRISIRNATAGSLILYDRLVTVSGLSGSQTTVDTAVNNTPLTRYTDGVGVELWAEFYGAIGATTATLNVKYTDQDGNTNQAGTYVHPANAESVGQMVPIVLASGDSGVRAVTNYHWSTNTGSAGNFGFTLLKRLLTINFPVTNIGCNLSALDHGITKREAAACIAMMVQCTTTNTGIFSGELQNLNK